MEVDQQSTTAGEDSRPRVRNWPGAGWLAVFLVAMAVWIGFDVAVPRPHDLRDFDGSEVGSLETQMWRSYYDHRPLSLFVQLSRVLQKQFHFRFWRSCLGAYYAAKAAVVFQEGHNRGEYLRALPDLERYYLLIRQGSNRTLDDKGFDDRKAAALELEWWIIHRERAQHAPGDLARALAELQAEIYQRDATSFSDHAASRAEAMLLRDSGAESGGVSEADWQRIGGLLDLSWVSLQRAVQH